MAVKRIIYLHNIVSRDNSELLYRVYSAMKNEPIKGDWINIVRKDMEEMDIKFSDDEISMMSKTDFKSIVKKKMRKHVLDELNTMKEGHSKVRDIVHGSMDGPQDYLTSGNLSNKHGSLLFNLRSKSSNEFKGNFQSSMQHFKCFACNSSDDTQDHSLICHEVRKHITEDQRDLIDSVVYADLFGPLDRKIAATEAFDIIIETRERLRAAHRVGLPGHDSGPSGL